MGSETGRKATLVSTTWVTIQETPFGTVDAAGDAKRQGWLDWMRDCGSSPQHCCSGPYPRRRRSYGEATGVVARGKAALSTQRSAPNFKGEPINGGSTVKSPQRLARIAQFRKGERDGSMVALGGSSRRGRAGEWRRSLTPADYAVERRRRLFRV